VAKHLKPNDVERIVGLIDSFEYDLTWENLVSECKAKLGITTTRQALSRKDRIKDAFNLRKKALKSNRGEYYFRPNSLDLAHQRLNRLAHENERLKLENERLLERFIRWQYNAALRGVTEAMLDRPLPQTDLASDRS